MVRAAVEKNPSLSIKAQGKLLEVHFSEGWGRLSHGITRQLKAPGRFGLKLVDVALIMSVFDRTIASINPILYAPIAASDFADETTMDESNIRDALKSLVARGILLKANTGRINFWAINPHYFSLNRNWKLPLGSKPPGSLPPNNAPHTKKGDLPPESGG